MVPSYIERASSGPRRCFRGWGVASTKRTGGAPSKTRSSSDGAGKSSCSARQLAGPSEGPEEGALGDESRVERGPLPDGDEGPHPDKYASRPSRGCAG